MWNGFMAILKTILSISTQKMGIEIDHGTFHYLRALKKCWSIGEKEPSLAK